MMSGGSPGSSLGRLTPFNGPPKQSEPEILEEGADSPEIDLNSDELSQRAPAKKKDRNYVIGRTEERSSSSRFP